MCLPYIFNVLKACPLKWHCQISLVLVICFYLSNRYIRTFNLLTKPSNPFSFFQKNFHQIAKIYLQPYHQTYNAKNFQFNYGLLRKKSY